MSDSTAYDDQKEDEEFGPPARIVAWNFQPDHCYVSAAGCAWGPKVWWCEAKDCPDLTVGGRTSGCAHGVTIPVGGSCSLATWQDDAVVWVGYGIGRLWTQEAGQPTPVTVWNLDHGWSLNVSTQSEVVLFGLTQGFAYGEPARTQAAWQARREKLEADWRRHAAEAPRPVVSRPHLGAVCKHAISFTGRVCPACHSRDTWYSTYNVTTTEVGYDAAFCSACDSWLETACSCESCAELGRPERPSQVPYDDVLICEPENVP